MMVQGSHLENSFSSSEFEVAYLYHYGKSLHHEYTGHHKKQELLLAHYGHDTQSRSQRKGADVSHKDFSWVAVVPQESEAGTGQGSEKHSELCSLGYRNNV